MSSPPTPSFWRSLCGAALLLLFAWGLPMGVAAQGFESILAPGKLIQGHAKVEEECKSCHTRLDRKAQTGLCLECHKDISTDVRSKNGFHGRMKPQACNVCHTDHKGRDAQIAKFDKKTFDHTQTDFALRGKHPQVECEKCHVAGKKYSEASSQCSVCHKKDDVHKGSLGAKCFDCHNETNWKEAKFDHSTTKFELKGKHADVKCVLRLPQERRRQQRPQGPIW
jgi:uncharacterized paraquat-inducible protein A